MSKRFGVALFGKPITPDSLDELLAFHRETFGDTRMEAETPAPGPTPAAPEPTAPPAPTGVTPASYAPPATDPAPAADGKVEDLPQWAQKALKDARDDAGKARTNAKQQAADEARQALAQEVGKALGLVKDGDAAPTPDQLAQQLATATAERAAEQAAHQTLQREHQVLLSAVEAGADHKRLLDSRTFLAKVADLDPTAEDFTTQVSGAVKDALTADPTLRTARAAGTSGVDHAGGSGENHDPAARALPGQNRMAAAYAASNG